MWELGNPGSFPWKPFGAKCGNNYPKQLKHKTNIFIHLPAAKFAPELAQISVIYTSEFSAF